jgi:hypothetical protein
VFLVVVGEVDALCAFMVRSLVAGKRDGEGVCPRLARFGVMSGDEGRGLRCDLRTSINAGRICRKGEST